MVFEREKNWALGKLSKIVLWPQFQNFTFWFCFLIKFAQGLRKCLNVTLKWAKEIFFETFFVVPNHSVLVCILCHAIAICAFQQQKTLRFALLRYLKPKYNSYLFALSLILSDSLIPSPSNTTAQRKNHVWRVLYGMVRWSQPYPEITTVSCEEKMWYIKPNNLHASLISWDYPFTYKMSCE